MEEIKVDILNIKDAYDNILKAINDLADVNGLDEEYKQLDYIVQVLDEKRIDLEAELENLEEEAMYKENEEQWKSEQKEQENQYWKSVL